MALADGQHRHGHDPHAPEETAPREGGGAAGAGEGAAEAVLGGAVEESAVPLPTHEELEQVRVQRDEYLGALQRMKADFENFRKRNERDRLVQRAAAARDVVMAVLPVLDNLERAVEALVQAGDEHAGGVEMVRVQLAQVLEGQGLKELEALGQPFDPTVHEALSLVPADAPEGTVVSVVEKGYRLGDGIVRAAKVVVASAPPGA